MQLIAKRHKRPPFDPGWGFGSLMVPVACALTWVILTIEQIFGMAPNEPIWALLPLLLLITLHFLEVVRAFKKRHSLPAEGYLSLPNYNIVCIGDPIELYQMRTRIGAAQRVLGASQITQHIFVMILVGLTALAWPMTRYVGISRRALLIAVWITLLSAIFWWLLMRTRYEVTTDAIRVVPVGFIRRLWFQPQTISLAEADVKIDFGVASIAVKGRSGEELEIDMDLLARRHAFANALVSAMVRCAERKAI